MLLLNSDLLRSDLGCRKTRLRVDPEMRFSREELVGSAFIALGITLFVGFFYAAIVSKLLPPYENQLLAAIQNDCMV
ncbi:hypothetical protein EJB05_39112 [Eragrostis curvula]|uniref:Uncharacterized protein n=1 Tax=Eragrostis curvula TaxID=38414 RepID=A0A5J9TVY9_9POAL|nr:hypothetical protein EJB05_39112 [Eragrostis curvula]